MPSHIEQHPNPHNAIAFHPLNRLSLSHRSTLPRPKPYSSSKIAIYLAVEHHSTIFLQWKEWQLQQDFVHLSKKDKYTYFFAKVHSWYKFHFQIYPYLRNFHMMRLSSWGVQWTWSHSLAAVKQQARSIVDDSKVQPKEYLPNLLLIERYDKVLVNLIRELKAAQWKEKLLFSREMTVFLRDTYRLAQRYLQAEGFEQYKANVQAIIEMSNPSKLIKRQSQSLSLTKNYMIIDQSEVVESARTLRRNPKHASILSVHTNRSSSSKKSSRKVSNNELIQLQALSQQFFYRKSAIAYRSLNRPSGSSNSSLRSSAYMNHHFTATTKHPSNFMNRQAVLPRSSAKLIQRGSELKIKEKRPERKSRFQLISKLQEESLRKEFEMYEAQEQQCSSEEDNHQVQIQREKEGRVRTRKESSKIFSCFEDVDRTNWHEIQPFFLFLQENHQLHLIRVEQLQSRQIIQENQDENDAKIKIKLIQPQIGIYLSLQWSFDQSEQIELEQMCLSFLIEHLKTSKREDGSIALKMGRRAIGRGGNVLQAEEIEEGMLMGFIRKISTFFIQQAKYSRKKVAKLFQYGIRKRLVTQQSQLISALEIKSRLMNYDLSMSFQQQQLILTKRGSVIQYIQTQDPANANLSAQLTYKLTYQHCALKDCEQARIQRIWISKTYQQYWSQPKKKKNRRKASSRIYKTIVGQQSLKKLRRTHHNKSSIKLSNKNLQSDLIVQHQHKGNSRFASKIDVIMSEKKLNHIAGSIKEQKTRIEIDRAKRTHNFVEAVRTDKGYKLIRKSAVLEVEGVKYHQYQGYLQRNPQLLRLWKGQQSLLPHNNYLTPSLSIRGSGSTQVSNTRLITFIKPLLNDNDYSFLGYLISDIKIMNLQANRCIFVETYWEKMQKQFIFTLSGQFFEQFTEINTTNFKAQPFLQGQEPIFKKKEREKRTSVMNTLMRHKHNDNTHDSIHKPHQNSREHPTGPKLNESLKFHQPKFWQSKNKFSQTFKTDKLYDSLSGFKHSKTFKMNQLKRQIVNSMKNRLVKNLSFIWKDHTIRLIIKNNGTNQKTFQSDEIETMQFEGRELAVKKVHELNNNKHIAAATELILIKYRQNNLTNLNIFTQEGLNQVSLEHIFIKNNTDLYGRYQSILELSTLPFNCNIGAFYRDKNLFFEKPSKNNSNKLSINRLKQTVQKFSLREEQKRFKYVEILGYAKQCCLPFEFVEQKRKRTVKQSFVVPNRFKILGASEQLLHISIQADFVIVSTLLGQEIIVFSLQKIQIYLPYIRRLEQRGFKQVFLRRVLEDQDVVRLCIATQDQHYFS